MRRFRGGPEAQIDRFMLKLRVDYPPEPDELRIVRQRTSPEDTPPPEIVLEADEIAALRRRTREVHVESSLAEYAVSLARATRELETVSLGASPRASIYLVESARARALLQGREFALPEDVKKVAPDVLRHRLRLTYEAEADGETPDHAVRAVLAEVPTP